MELEDWKHVVYAIGCERCGVHYVGETGQHYCDRRKQHQRDVKNRKTTNGLYDLLKTQGKLGESNGFGQGGQLEGRIIKD